MPNPFACWQCFKNWYRWEFGPCNKPNDGNCHDSNCWFWLSEPPKCDKHKEK